MPSNITIKTTVPDYAPVYNKNEFCVTEVGFAPSTKTNYTYVFDIVTETFGTIRTLVLPEPVMKFGIQDVGQILEGYVKEKIMQYNNTSAFVYAQEVPIIKYHMEYLSAWDVAGVFTVDPDAVGAVVGKDNYTWGASFNWHDWVSQMNSGSPFNTWLLNTTNGTAGEFLTSYKTPSVNITDLGWTCLLTDNAPDVDYVEIKTYNAAGGLIQTAQAANITTPTTTGAKMMSVATSPQSLNNVGAALLAGSQPIIDSTTKTYTVQIFKTTGTVAISELLTFTIEECTPYEIFRVHFENYLGGFDSFNFRLRSKRSANNEKLKYNRAGNDVISTGLQYSQEDNGTLAYFVKSQDTIRLESDYLDTTQNQWLKELIESPQVYLEFIDNGVANFKPLFVTNSAWTQDSNELDKQFRLTLQVDLAHENYRQRR